MKKSLVSGFGVCTILFFCSGMVEAGPLDHYRQMVGKREFTLKYEQVTPAPRVKNRDKLHLYNRSGMETDGIKFLTNNSSTGVLMVKGDFKYEEVVNGDNAVGKITLQGKTYNYVRGLNKGKMEYFGSGKKGAVKEEKINYFDEASYGESFGDRILTRVIQILQPDSQKALNIPKFSFYGSGNVNGGLHYEDYVCRKENEAVRYYFKGNRMVKIAAANYYKDVDGSIKGSRSIIKVLEFSPTVDKNSMQLPTGMKVEKLKAEKAGEEE